MLFRPDFAAAWMNLGIVLAGLKHHSEAETSYFTALAYRKKYPDCYYNLGNLVSIIFLYFQRNLLNYSKLI
jgi:Flp pilus assembly protein TadD